MALGLRSARPKLDTQFASAARADLAIAIAARDARDARAAGISAAMDQLQRDKWDAQDRVAAAQAALGGGLDAVGSHGMAAAAGLDAGEPPATLALLRQRLQDAKDAAATADASHKQAHAALDEIQGDRWKLDEPVKEAALRVLREAPGVAQMVATVERLHRELYDAGTLAGWAISAGIIELRPQTDWRDWSENEQRAKRVKYALDRTLLDWPHTYRDTRDRTPTPACWADETSPVTAWKDALAALMVDATAPLPEVPK